MRKVRKLEHQVYLSLGSNIDPEKNLSRAVRLLRESVEVVKASSVWETPAVGTAGPDFLNMALWIVTDLSPRELKNSLLRGIETRLGRVRSINKNAPRPIDLDIIIFDDTLIDQDLWIFAHLAVPMAELYPGFAKEANGETLAEAAEKLALMTPIHRKPG